MAKWEEWIESDNLKKLEAWARDGLRDEDIANKIGIARSTLYEWKKKHKDISDALKRGKEVVDIEVENTLLKKALGYEYKEKMAFKKKNADGSESIEMREVTRYAHPDTTSIIFWLKNRKPVQWRDKQEIENINRNIELTIGDWEDED